MNISAKTKMCIIIGDPVEHSLSPAMHNAAYEHLGIDDQFVFTAAHVEEKDIETIVHAVRSMGIRGLTCTIPHKVSIIKYLNSIDPIAEKIGAVNTVVNTQGHLKGYNTDWLGTITPLEEALKGTLQNKKVAIVGAGGAARAMAYGVIEKGAHLTVFNRSIENAQDLVDDLNKAASTPTPATVKPLDALSILPEFDVIINATSIGMGEQKDETPVDKRFIRKNHIVFDAVYAPRETRLIQEAREQGATTIYGLEMLLHQGAAQFELYTDHKAPVEVMRSILYT